jgi:hypothetical protein
MTFFRKPDGTAFSDAASFKTYVGTVVHPPAYPISIKLLAGPGASKVLVNVEFTFKSFEYLVNHFLKPTPVSGYITGASLDTDFTDSASCTVAVRTVVSNTTAAGAKFTLKVTKSGTGDTNISALPKDTELTGLGISSKDMDDPLVANASISGKTVVKIALCYAATSVPEYELHSIDFDLDSQNPIRVINENIDQSVFSYSPEYIPGSQSYLSARSIVAKLKNRYGKYNGPGDLDVSIIENGVERKLTAAEYTVSMKADGKSASLQITAADDPELVTMVPIKNK